MMNQKHLYLICHGETDWSRDAKQSGRTDLPLNQEGERQAKALGQRLRQICFDHIFASPLKRVYTTCQLCALHRKALTVPELVEWDSGEHEGKCVEEICSHEPAWTLFTHGSYQGETVEQVLERTEHFLHKLDPLEGQIAIFAGTQICKLLAVTLLGLPVDTADLLALDAASISSLQLGDQQSTLTGWNDVSHYRALEAELNRNPAFKDKPESPF